MRFGPFQSLSGQAAAVTGFRSIENAARRRREG